MTIARFLGDLAHLASFGIIIYWIENVQSCVGFSGKMQVLQTAAYLTRYRDFLLFNSVYYSLIKMISMTLSIHTLYLIFSKYKKTYEKRCDSFWIESIIFTATTLAFVLHIDDDPTPEEVSWLFSHFIESVSIIPQIYFYFLKQHKDTIVSYYIMSLALYRGFYIIDWIIDDISENDDLDDFVVYPAIIQIILYGVYFSLPKGNEESLPIYHNVAPKFMTQLSLLETPLLKRTATSSSSIYIIGMDSTSGSLNGSISGDSQSTNSSEIERY